MGKLAGKVALITGGTTGIGAATARLFRDEGATVIVTGSGDASVSDARASLPGIEVVRSDAADTAATHALVDDIAARCGRIDILFVNAGFALVGTLATIDEEQFDRQFNVNVRGAFFTIKHAVTIMPDGGAILLTGSIAGSRGGPGASLYGASKAALRSFGLTLASELAPRCIRVNTISPGPIDTPFFDRVGFTADQRDAMEERWRTSIPLGRKGRPEDVAAAALYLASDDATFVTGIELFVDGGTKLT